MKPTQPTIGQRSCPPKVAWVVTLLVGLHLLAVVAEPLRFFSQSEFQAGPEFLALRRWTAPYVDWLYLDHGYFFFAPNPGPSHLVGVSVDSPQAVDQTVGVLAPSVADGEGLRLDRWGYVFPDRKRQWPRLLYHRYFMLSEFYNNTFAPARLLDADRADPEFVEQWRKDRALHEALRASIERSMERTLGVARVVLDRIERLLPTPDQVLRDGWALDDPRGLMLLEDDSASISPISPSGEGTGVSSRGEAVRP